MYFLLLMVLYLPIFISAVFGIGKSALVQKNHQNDRNKYEADASADTPLLEHIEYRPEEEQKAGTCEHDAITNMNVPSSEYVKYRPGEEHEAETYEYDANTTDEAPSSEHIEFKPEEICKAKKYGHELNPIERASSSYGLNIAEAEDVRKVYEIELERLDDDMTHELQNGKKLKASDRKGYKQVYKRTKDLLEADKRVLPTLLKEQERALREKNIERYQDLLFQWAIFTPRTETKSTLIYNIWKRYHDKTTTQINTNDVRRRKADAELR